jgi:predicted nucleic acid-binding protein
VNRLVIDASIAVKWVVEEKGTPYALALRGRALFLAPDLLVAECANIFWKKTQRRELARDEALLAARLLAAGEIELVPTRNFLKSATALAIALGHPAYDCLYMAVALDRGCPFVTADDRLLRKLEQAGKGINTGAVIGLADAASASARGSKKHAE